MKEKIGITYGGPEEKKSLNHLKLLHPNVALQILLGIMKFPGMRVLMFILLPPKIIFIH